MIISEFYAIMDGNMDFTPKIAEYATDTRPVIIIPDLHGDSVALQQILDWGADSNPQYVFLGDYIDRGPDSKGVLDLVMQTLADYSGSAAICGNHDEYFRDFVNGDFNDSVRNWLESDFIDGRGCLASFNITTADPAAIPGKYRDFLNGLADLVVLHTNFGDIVCAHGGIDWGLPLAEQSRETLRFGTYGFWSNTNANYRVFFGHWAWDRPKIWPDRIGLDVYDGVCFVCFDVIDGYLEFYQADNAGVRPYPARHADEQDEVRRLALEDWR